jgi:hypothetical protein
MLYLHIENIECSAAKAHTHGAAFPAFTLPDQASIAFLPRSLITGMPAYPMRRCDGILLWLPMRQRQPA